MRLKADRKLETIRNLLTTIDRSSSHIEALTDARLNQQPQTTGSPSHGSATALHFRSFKQQAVELRESGIDLVHEAAMTRQEIDDIYLNAPESSSGDVNLDDDAEKKYRKMKRIEYEIRQSVYLLRDTMAALDSQYRW